MSVSLVKLKILHFGSWLNNNNGEVNLSCVLDLAGSPLCPAGGLSKVTHQELLKQLHYPMQQGVAAATQREQCKSW